MCRYLLIMFSSPYKGRGLSQESKDSFVCPDRRRNGGPRRLPNVGSVRSDTPLLYTPRPRSGTRRSESRRRTTDTPELTQRKRYTEQNEGTFYPTIVTLLNCSVKDISRDWIPEVYRPRLPQSTTMRVVCRTAARTLRTTYSGKGNGWADRPM